MLMILAVGCAATLLGAGTTAATPPAASPPSDDPPTASPPIVGTATWCDGPDLVLALSHLETGSRLVVTRGADRLTVLDPVAGVTLLSATCSGLAIAGLETVERPGPHRRARTVAVQDHGETVYTHSATARGARVTVIAPGQVDAAGLSVMAFDNDDLHVTDGDGQLLYSRMTTPAGALIVRESTGCHCEHETAPDGTLTVRPLSFRSR